MNVAIDVRVQERGGSWLAIVRVVQEGRRTVHRVTVTPENLSRYRARDARDLARRSFVFLLSREPNTSILREFRVSEIERYFPDFPRHVTRP